MKTDVHLAWFISEWEMFQKTYIEEIKTTFYVKWLFHPRVNSSGYEMWKIWYNQAGHRWQNGNVYALFMMDTTNATDTHSEYVTLIAFPLQKWLNERASVLLLYVHCLSRFSPFQKYYCTTERTVQAIKQYRDVECQNFWKHKQQSKWQRMDNCTQHDTAITYRPTDNVFGTGRTLPGRADWRQGMWKPNGEGPSSLSLWRA